MTYKNCQGDVRWLIRFARRMGVTYKICQGYGGRLMRFARRMVGDLTELSGS